MRGRADRSWRGTPEVIRAREKMYVRAMTIMCEERHPEVLEMLGGIGSPAYLLARVTAMIIRDTYQELKDEVPDEVIVPVALDVVELLVDIAVNRVLFPCDDAVMAAAKQRVLLKLTH